MKKAKKKSAILFTLVAVLCGFVCYLSIRHPEDFMASNSSVPLGSVLLGIIALVYAIAAIFKWRDIHNSKE